MVGQDNLLSQGRPERRWMAGDGKRLEAEIGEVGEIGEIWARIQGGVRAPLSAGQIRDFSCCVHFRQTASNMY